MKNLLKSKAGFTMVELMVVVIIVAILAAAAIPLYTANIKRAIKTEADSTLGAIRSGERIYKAEFNAYTPATSDGILTVLRVNLADPHYFSPLCYDVAGTDSTFLVTCTNIPGNTAPGADQATKYFGNGIVATMDQKGTIGP